MAIETRVHCLWNHLIESASMKTGSLLIWDTGTYELLPRKKESGTRRLTPSPNTTGDEDGGSELSDGVSNRGGRGRHDKHENEKLISAFQTRYMRLRLHGTRLPKDYTLILRLPSNEIIKRPPARRKPQQKVRRKHQAQSQGDDHTENESESDLSAGVQTREPDPDETLVTDSEEDFQTRAENAYPGSTNDIGSVHQRHWFLQLDRQSSGFVLEDPNVSQGKKQWRRGEDGMGFEAFFVRGRDHERSVVTGRLAQEVESDEGVEGFVGRGGWTGIEY